MLFPRLEHPRVYLQFFHLVSFLYSSSVFFVFLIFFSTSFPPIRFFIQLIILFIFLPPLFSFRFFFHRQIFSPLTTSFFRFLSTPPTPLGYHCLLLSFSFLLFSHVQCHLLFPFIHLITFFSPSSPLHNQIIIF